MTKPHPSPCCPVSARMLLHCDISQSLLASCGSRFMSSFPRLLLSAPSFAPAAHPSNLNQPCPKDTSCSAPGAAALFYPLDLGTVFAERLGTWGHCWGHGDITAPLCKEQPTGAETPSPAQPRVQQSHPKNLILKHESRFPTIHFSLRCQLYPIGNSIKG